MTLKISTLFLLSLLGFFTFLLLRNGMTNARFALVSIIWIGAMSILFASNVSEAIKITLDSVSLLIALLAFLISIVTFGLQQTPTLLLHGVQIREAEQRLYMYFRNSGTIGAYQIKGSYAITAHDEPSSGKTANEKLLAFSSFEVKDEAFYPDADNITVITQKLHLQEKISEQKRFVYFSVAIQYPRLQVGNFTFGKKGFEGVYLFDDQNHMWVKSTKTHLPEYFSVIFAGLKNSGAPKLPIKEE